jgi:uncharacterized protein (TIGR03118 family)
MAILKACQLVRYNGCNLGHATPARSPSQVPAGFVPFNVQNINGKVYVTYAPPGRAAQTSATAGMGAVAIFDENGVFQQMAAVGGPLAAPWGITLAPASFGPFANDLLVGKRPQRAGGPRHALTVGPHLCLNPIISDSRPN